MVQLAPRPPQRRFNTNPQAQRRPIQQPQSDLRPSRTRLLRYRLLVLKVRIKVFFIKARRKPRLTGSVLASLIMIVTAGILFLPRNVQSQTELDYYRAQLDRIKSSVGVVKEQNPREAEVEPLSNQIEDYKNALLDGLAACEEMEIQAEQVNKEVMKDYLDAVAHARQFCGDYEDVADYARRVSKATKQLIILPTEPLASAESTSSITDLIEIIGYTRTDLGKLNGSPLDDPALEEMIISIDTLQKLAEETQQNPSSANRTKLANETAKQQDNLIHARIYFWTNSVKIDALDRSITRLRAEFNPKS